VLGLAFRGLGLGEPKDVISYGMLRSDWEASGLADEQIEIAGRIPSQFL
jgi:hypothetical protein